MCSRTPGGCRYGEACWFLHGDSSNTGGSSQGVSGRNAASASQLAGAETVEIKGKTFEVKNGRIRGPPSHLGVPLPEAQANPDKTPIKCGESVCQFHVRIKFHLFCRKAHLCSMLWCFVSSGLCKTSVHGVDELYNHYYVNLLLEDPDHTDVFRSEKVFK